MNTCTKCNRPRYFDTNDHILCISSDIKKVYVVHDYYGCDTGCCGHSTIIITTRGEECSYFEFDHPYGETYNLFIKRMIIETSQKVGFKIDFNYVDYESCEVLDD